jgi:hypothetical protein
VLAVVAQLLELKSLLLNTNQFTDMYPVAKISRLTGLEVLTLTDNVFSPAPVLLKLTNQLTREIHVAFDNL